VAIAFSPVHFGKIFIVVPLVCIYFTVLILYSYRIHSVLALYLHEKIEPELARLCGTSLEREWETFYGTKYVPGIRRWFFLVALWVMSVGSLVYLWLVESGQSEFRIVLIVATALYISSLAAITKFFWRD